jgi:hypothetical protein
MATVSPGKFRAGNMSRLYEFLMKFNVFIYVVNSIARSKKTDRCLLGSARRALSLSVPSGTAHDSPLFFDLEARALRSN